MPAKASQHLCTQSGSGKGICCSSKIDNIRPWGQSTPRFPTHKRGPRHKMTRSSEYDRFSRVQYFPISSGSKYLVQSSEEDTILRFVLLRNLPLKCKEAERTTKTVVASLFSKGAATCTPW
ncbi:hypothetical protein NLI96_g7630 [Meripilus lineatus]|uniref:Uncharacterized protein n=1 Tax=Meripilus lineatus TaxID=2056292 RepID=A0AAD5UYR6_9APHY|nr:hypothetical protein NLI96_g7630 [Physisporinus lineatus]